VTIPAVTLRLWPDSGDGHRALVAELRAIGSRHGRRLGPVGDVDAAAAAVAAELVAHTTGAWSLADLTLDPAATVALARIVERACGSGSTTDAWPRVLHAAPVHVLGVVDDLCERLDTLTPPVDVGEVFRRAAADLTVDLPDGPCSVTADALRTAADSVEVFEPHR
jgi:hypothetical protein